jgi:hypothetical protein
MIRTLDGNGSSPLVKFGAAESAKTTSKRNYGSTRSAFAGELRGLLANRGPEMGTKMGLRSTPERARAATASAVSRSATMPSRPINTTASTSATTSTAAPQSNPLYELFGSSPTPRPHVPPAPTSAELKGKDLLTIPMTQPIDTPQAGSAQADPCEFLRQRLTSAGVDCSGWKLENREFEAFSPTARYVDKQVMVDFGGGKREFYSADLLMKSPDVAVCEIKRLAGSGV